MSNAKKYALVCKDKYKTQTVFEQNNFNVHAKKHSELRQPTFFPERVTNCLENPDLIIESHVDHLNGRVYYFEEFSSGGKIRYTKVVVVKQTNPELNVIITVHRPDYIKEYQYSDHKVIFKR